jgi:hypothetical protein
MPKTGSGRNSNRYGTRLEGRARGVTDTRQLS